LGAWFPAYEGTPKGAITLAQLSSMTHGLPNDSACIDDRTTALALCAEEILALPLASTPGSTFDYGGTGLQVAVRMVELATGSTWDEVFSVNLAGPLGLTTVDFSVAPSANPQVAGGAVATASDYDRFLEMVEGGGVFRGIEVLSPVAFDAMETNYARGLPSGNNPFPTSAG